MQKTIDEENRNLRDEELLEEILKWRKNEKEKKRILKWMENEKEKKLKEESLKQRDEDNQKKNDEDSRKHKDKEYRRLLVVFVSLQTEELLHCSQLVNSLAVGSVIDRSEREL